MSPSRSSLDAGSPDDDPLEAALRAAYTPPAGEPPASSLLRALRERSAAPHDAAPARPSSARYHLLDELGKGGVGVVCRGRDLDLGRDVAVKLLRPDAERDVELVKRFVEEAQVGGQLQHPGIVPVYELGLLDEQRPFIAMKLVAGETLAQQLAARASPEAEPHRFLAVFEHVCDALAYAHARGVIHRDLKPHNVMIGAFGEVVVLDWGFAKVLGRAAASAPAAAATPVATRRGDDHDSRSVAGSVMGTPAYMAPEQARGEVDALDARADVFSLGAMLCEILTGRAAFPGPQTDALARARQGDLADAHAALRACRAEAALVQLALDCLQAAPAARPPHAGVLAERVRQHRGSVAERARQAELAAAQAQVRARATRTLAATIVAALALGAGAWILVANASHARRAQVAQQVSTALQEARERFGAASGSDDAAQWREVAAAAERARALAAGPDAAPEDRAATGELERAARARHDAAQAAATARARDAAMQARLSALRQPADEDVMHPAWPQREARRLLRGYAAAFADYGLDPAALAGTPEADALRDHPLAAELAVACDHWAMAAQAAADPTTAAPLRSLARQLDGDPLRARLRELLAQAPLPVAALRELANASELAQQPPLGVFLLADALLKVNEAPTAVAALARGAQTHPGDFLLAFWLGIARQRLPDPDTAGALQALAIARALRPELSEVQHRIGMVHEWRRDARAALAVFEALARAHPDDPHWLTHLGRDLLLAGRSADALATHRRVLELTPDAASAHVALGTTLRGTGDLAGATASFQRAIALDAGYAPAHFELGLLLADEGDAARGLPHLERAFALSGAIEHLWSIASVRKNSGDLDGALATFRRTLEIDPRFAEGHFGLGSAQREALDLDGARASLRRAIELMPRRAKYHAELAMALGQSGDHAGAAAASRAALALNPDHVVALCVLCESQQHLDQPEDARATLQRAAQLGAQEQGFPVADTLAKLDAAIARRRDLAAIARGERPAPDAADAAAAAELAAQQGNPRLAARAWRQAFAAHRDLGADFATGPRLRAAVAAVQASALPELHADERVELRQFALDWLRAELTWLTPHSASADQTAARARLGQWLESPELEPVRATASLAELPSDQAEAWRQAWRRAELLRR